MCFGGAEVEVFFFFQDVDGPTKGDGRTDPGIMSEWGV